MARKRSWRELMNLRDYAANRVLSGKGGDLSSGVTSKAWDYADNIKNSKSGRQNAERYKSAVKKYGVKQARAMFEKALTRKYSANTYMGLSNG